MAIYRNDILFQRARHSGLELRHGCGCSAKQVSSASWLDLRAQNPEFLSECKGESESRSEVSDDQGKCSKDLRYGVRSAKVAPSDEIEGLFRY